MPSGRASSPEGVHKPSHPDVKREPRQEEQRDVTNTERHEAFFAEWEEGHQREQVEGQWSIEVEDRCTQPVPETKQPPGHQLALKELRCEALLP